MCHKVSGCFDLNVIIMACMLYVTVLKLFLGTL